MDTLFKAVEKRGLTVKGEPPYQLWLEVGKERIDFSLRERMKQVKRPLNDAEKRSPFYSDKQWRRETVSAGDLIFTIKTYIETGLTKGWRDGERRLEEQVSEIVAVLLIAVPILQEQRRQAEEAERQRREEEHRLYEERAKQQRDKNRWRLLSSLRPGGKRQLWQRVSSRRCANCQLMARRRSAAAPPANGWTGRARNVRKPIRCAGR